MKDLDIGGTSGGSSSTAESSSWAPGVKLGIVRLGRAAGKMKYTLLDERDIILARDFTFEARLEIDKNGNGAKIYAYAFHITKGRRYSIHLHDLLWEKHFGGIAPGWKVAHKNDITMDNRLANLHLVPLVGQSPVVQHEFSAGLKFLEQSLYWAAIQQLPADHLIDEHFSDTSKKFYDANGDPIDEEEEATCYYECHYPPCIKIEREPREFSICGRCQEARYCGTVCQQQDWPVHKKFCREKQRPVVLRDRQPER